MEQINEYTLTEDEKGMVIPMIETAENIQRETQTVLRAITRLRGLEGQWNLMGDKLIRVNATPAPAPQQPEPVGATTRNGKE